MPSKIHTRGKMRWMARVQKNGLIKQKLFDTKTGEFTVEASEVSLLTKFIRPLARRG